MKKTMTKFRINMALSQTLLLLLAAVRSSSEFGLEADKVSTTVTTVVPATSSKISEEPVNQRAGVGVSSTPASQSTIPRPITTAQPPHTTTSHPTTSYPTSTPHPTALDTNTAQPTPTTTSHPPTSYPTSTPYSTTPDNTTAQPPPTTTSHPTTSYPTSTPHPTTLDTTTAQPPPTTTSHPTTSYPTSTLYSITPDNTTAQPTPTTTSHPTTSYPTSTPYSTTPDNTTAQPPPTTTSHSNTSYPTSTPHPTTLDTTTAQPPPTTTSHPTTSYPTSTPYSTTPDNTTTQPPPTATSHPTTSYPTSTPYSTTPDITTAQPPPTTTSHPTTSYPTSTPYSTTSDNTTLQPTSEPTAATTDFPYRDLTVRLALLPPRSMQATWNASETEEPDKLCYRWKHRNLTCVETVTGEVIVPVIPAGTPITVYVVRGNIEGPNSTMYVPWQLGIGNTTSSSILVEWHHDESVYSVQLLRHNELDCYNPCEMWDPRSCVFTDLEASTEYEILLISRYEDLVIYATTNGDEVYNGVSWHCSENPCQSNGTCFPATDNLLPVTDPQETLPTSYPFTCRWNTSSQFGSTATPVWSKTTSTEPETTSIGPSTYHYTKHFDFTASMQYHLTPSCTLPNSLALVSYWCDGKHRSEAIINERLHTYFVASDGCRQSNVARFTQTNIANLTHYTSMHCKENFIPFFDDFSDELTCYGPLPNQTKYSNFDDARHECLNFGGDLAFIISNQSFTDFLYGNFSQEAFWVLGTAKTRLSVRPPMIYSTRVDRAYLNTEYNSSVYYCLEDCEDYRARPLCAIPPTYVPRKRIKNPGSYPDKCPTEFCKNGGTCYPVSYTPGVGLTNSSYICRCTPEFSGLQCEVGKSLIDEILEPEDDIYYITGMEQGPLKIEFGYFGQIAEGDEFLGCYAKGATAILRLKCEGQTNCSISRRDLQNHLSSTCHPNIPQDLRVRMSFHDMSTTELSCEFNGEYYSTTGTCFAMVPFPEEEEVTADGAKFLCNSLGGNLAYSYYDLELCADGNYSLWAVDFKESKTPNFRLDVGSGVVMHCGSESNITSGALCEMPPVATCLTTTSAATTTTTTTTTTTLGTTDKPITDCPNIKPLPDLYPNYVWQSAPPGTHTFKKCPPGSDVTGSNVTWYCNKRGIWDGLPDFSHCKTLDLSDWENALNDTSSNTTAGETLDKVADNITDANIGTGDVVELVNLMSVAKTKHDSDLTKASEEQKLNITDGYTSSLTRVSSKLLNSSTVEMWGGIPLDKRLESGNQLQEQLKDTVTELSLLLANQSRVYKASAIYILAEQYSSERYIDPKTRTFAHPTMAGTVVELPHDFYSSLPNKSRVAVSFTAYDTLHRILSDNSNSTPADAGLSTDIVNSPIIALTVGNSSWQAKDGQLVNITFKHIFSGKIYNLSAGGRCVWWDSEEKNWNDSGCSLTGGGETESFTFCSCDHLTNLAVIIDINGLIPEIIITITKWITIIGCSISLVCLFLAIVTLASMVKNYKGVSHNTFIIHLNLCSSLFVTEIVLLAGLDATQTTTGCAFVAGLLHFLILVTFGWMGVEGMNIYLLLIKVFPTSTSPMKFYYAFAYGLPAFIVILSVSVTQGEGYGTKGYCWLDYRTGLTWAFGAPALVILLTNLVIYIMSVRVLRKAPVTTATAMGRQSRKSLQRETRSREEKKKQLKRSFTLAVIMGITWLIGFLLLFKGMAWTAILFTTVNSLQGTALFIVLIIIPDLTRKEFLRILPSCDKRESERWYTKWNITRHHRRVEYQEHKRRSSTPTFMESRLSSTMDENDSVQESYSYSIPRPSLGTAFRAEPVPINPRGSGELDLHIRRDIERLGSDFHRRY